MKTLSALFACLVLLGCQSSAPGPAGIDWPYPGKLHGQDGREIVAPSWTNVPYKVYIVPFYFADPVAVTPRGLQ